MKDLFVSLNTVLIAVLFGCLCSLDMPYIFNLPPMLIIVIISFCIHLIVFIPSYYFKTEKYYDITGTISYLVIILFSLYFAQNNSGALTFKTMIVAACIIIWSMRLGLFLFIRVLQVGEDSRFAEAKESFFKFLMFFCISALWVILTTINSLTIILNNSNKWEDMNFYIGIGIWIIGFAFEVIADEQKRVFRKNKLNKGKFITTGLWAISRHPNYFGEILIWIGLAIISLSGLISYQYITLISPLFVILLLTNVSGINLLEISADKKWGNLEAYNEYKRNTARLIPYIY